MNARVVAFLTKPLDADALLRAVDHAIDRSRATLRREGEA
jgi:FixJ family two-component response regulator